MRKLILSIRFRADQLKALKALAKERGISIGWLVRRAVDEWLKRRAQ